MKHSTLWCFLTLSSTSLMLAAAVLNAQPLLVFFFIITVCLVTAGIFVDNNKVLSVLLVCSMIALPAQAQAQERPKPLIYYACATVVVVFGVVVVVKMKRFCDKHYKRQTNSAPEELFLSATGGDTSAAVDNWFCQYCTSAPDLVPASAIAHPETIIEGTISGGNISLSVVTNIGNYYDFVQEMSALGLPMQPGKHYARNGQRANQWDVPIIFPQERGEVPHVTIVGENQKTSVIWRSFDLATWVPILTNTIPSHMVLQFEDNTTSASAFYRVVEL